MEGNLIIVESPTKAREITAFLKKRPEGYKVVSSKGHIRDLGEKKLSVDIDGGFIPQYEVPAEKKRLVAELKALADNAGTVYLAADPDREGEAIAWHLAVTLGLDPARTKRITYHEITKKAIEEALQNPRDLDMNLVNAQQARRVLDRLVGFELSPILWKKINRGLSAGRVQSVALRLVVDREREIMAFRPEPYYRTEGRFETVGGASLKGTLDIKFKTPQDAEKFLRESIGALYTIASVDKADGTRFPAAPFTTSTLQQEASRKLHFSVSQTMRVAQELFEKGLITYMRTDSTNLSDMAISAAKKFITETFGAGYSHPRKYTTRSRGAQEAHEAIRPTFLENTEINGTAQEKALYSLIWKRTVASQMAEARLLNTTIVIENDRTDGHFVAEASEIVFDGFLKLYMEGTDDDSASGDFTILPSASAGERLIATEIVSECKFTRAPQRYTEASLVKKLEELEIGRPSTYSPTITTLTKTRGYITTGNKQGTPVEVTNFKLKGTSLSSSRKKEMVGEDRGKLLPQDVGLLVTDYLVENFPDIMDFNYTATVEDNLDKIAEGRLDWKKYLGTIYPPFHKEVEEKMHDGQYKHAERVLGTDPADGQLIVARFGQYGPYVQKGEGENRRFASLEKGQLIENVSLEEAIKLLALPRVAGSWEGRQIIVTKGKFGPYLKYGERNITLPRKADPLTISLEDCIALIREQDTAGQGNSPLLEFPGEDITVLNGRYGPYIKHAGKNFRIPKGTDAAALTAEQCRDIIKNSNKK